MTKYEFKKFDIFLSISIVLLGTMVAINNYFSLNLKLALFNFIISILPFLYLIFKNKKMQLNKNGFNFMLFIIIFIRIITSLTSYIYLDTSTIIEQICYDLSFIIISFSVFSFCKNKTDEKLELKYVTKVLIVLSIIFSIYNIIDNFDKFSYFTNIKYRYMINFSSFFNNKNLYGIFLFLSIICINYEEKISSKRFFLSVLKFFLIINLILTLSRAAVLAYVVYFIIKNLCEKKYKILIVFLLVILVFIFFNCFGFRNFLLTFLIRSDSMTSGRNIIWKKCFEYFYKKPILGYGELYISNLINSFSGVTGMHNWFIKLLLNGGIINLCCYQIIIFNQIYIAIKNKLNLYFPIIIASLFSFVIYGLFEEINLFEFGMINIIITLYFIFIPNIFIEGVKNEK